MIDDVVAYFSDVVVQEATSNECMKHLEACPNRLGKHDVHLNKDK